MKKIFALALAAVMTAGMTTVAFAADEITSVELGGVSTRLFEYDADNNRADHVDDTSVLEPGKTYYISLEINGVESYDKLGGDLDIDAKDMNKYKVYTDWKYGEIEDFEVAYKKIELHDGSVWGGYDYRYVIEFTTPEDNTASAFEDVAGTVKVGTTSSKADKAGSYDLSATITKEITFLSSTVTSVSSPMALLLSSRRTWARSTSTSRMLLCSPLMLTARAS